ncbi:MAG: hypothetical protein WAR57_02860 [Candidatus Phosphoribacter sp.]|nr:hypothetical protein [Actinomycetales bacterium]
MKRLHRALAVTAAAASTIALSACSFFSPIQTDNKYIPGDGVPAQLGLVAARNLAIVSERAGGPGALTGAVLNQGDGQAQVSFLTREDAEAGVAPASPISLGGREHKVVTGVVFEKVAKAPGSMADIYLVTSEGRQLVSVPVLAPQGVYADLKP